MSSRKRYKGVKHTESYTAAYHSALRSERMQKLSGKACKLLLELMGQFSGNNNGDLTCSWSVLKDRGWVSKQTLTAARDELMEAGFVYETRAGAFPSTAQLLALTWLPLDVNPKFDEHALRCFTPKAYLKPTDKPQTAVIKNDALSPIIREGADSTGLIVREGGSKNGLSLPR